MKSAFRTLFALLAGAACLHARAELYPVSFEQRSDAADSIVLATLTQQHTYWAEPLGVMTANTLAVNAWLKGSRSDSEVVVLTLGGVLDDRATVASPSLALEYGQEYLVFLDAEEWNRDDRALRARRPALRQSFAYADVQGAMPRQLGQYRDTFGQHRDVEQALDAIAQRVGHPARRPSGEFYLPSPAWLATPDAVTAISNFTPNPTRAGTIVPGDFVTITGSGFGASAGSVFYSNADDGGASLVSSGVASDNTAWSDTSITNKVASRAGTGPISINGTQTSAGSLTVQWAHTAIDSNFSGFASNTRQRYYLRNLDASGGMTFAYNTASFSSNGAARWAFERALATWRCDAGIHFATSGTTANINANDGVNTVLFDASLPAGVLGQAVSNFSGSANGACNLQNSVWWVKDIDVRFKPDPPVAGYSWQYGPTSANGAQYDFQSVAVHELGHGLGLGHRIASGEVMHFQIANGVTARSPSALEIAAAQNKLAYSTAAICFNPVGAGTPMVAQPALGCALLDSIFANGFQP